MIFKYLVYFYQSFAVLIVEHKTYNAVQSNDDWEMYKGSSKIFSF